MSRGLTMTSVAIVLSLCAADAACAADSGAVENARPRSANPLWAIPLTSLSDTRARPVFSPSRRPPPPVVDTRPAPPPPPPRKREIERPPLSLVGTVASNEEGFGIFLDLSTKQALRLKLGEDYQGWKLRAVRGQQVSLEKDQQITVLTLPEPSGQIKEFTAPVKLNADGLSPQVALRRK